MPEQAWELRPAQQQGWKPEPQPEAEPGLPGWSPPDRWGLRALKPQRTEPAQPERHLPQEPSGQPV